MQEALQQDPEFYDFLRSMESYETSIKPGSTMLLTDQHQGYLSNFTTLPHHKD